MLKTRYRKAGFSARFSFSILNPLPTLFVLIWSGYGLLHYGSFDFIAWVAVLLLGSGMAEAVMPMMMLNNFGRANAFKHSAYLSGSRDAGVIAAAV